MISKPIWDVITFFNKVEKLNYLKVLIFSNVDIYFLIHTKT